MRASALRREGRGEKGYGRRGTDVEKGGVRGACTRARRRGDGGARFMLTRSAEACVVYGIRRYAVAKNYARIR